MTEPVSTAGGAPGAHYRVRGGPSLICPGEQVAASPSADIPFKALLMLCHMEILPLPRTYEVPDSLQPVSNASFPAFWLGLRSISSARMRAIASSVRVARAYRPRARSPTLDVGQHGLEGLEVAVHVCRERDARDPHGCGSS